LLGLGLRQFSVHPSLLLEVKHVITQTDVTKIGQSARHALTVSDPEELNILLSDLL
jgi:phosphotransferase system enzyme I (PtsI)